MSRRAENPFVSVRTEGGLLPPEVLQRIAAADEKRLDGLSPASYRLPKGERIKEAISRSWSRLTGAWAAFRSAAEKLPESDAGTTLTRERWLLPLFSELGYGRLPISRGIEAGGVSFPVSHVWQNTPVHLVSFRVDIDTSTSLPPPRAGEGRGGGTSRPLSRCSPHSLLQQLLNRSDSYLWGFVSNGNVLRVLRDNASLSRQAHVEFDLVSMMEGELYSDFCLLWLLCHQTRVEAEKPEECWLEVWTRAARDEGRRALDGLRDGVEKAINVLGQGFLTHPANGDLRDALRSGSLSRDDYYRHILRLVYRLLFLLVAEDRDLLLHPAASSQARERYLRFFSMARLRQLAARRRGSRHADLWRGLLLVMESVGTEDGCLSLGLPALGGFLFSKEAVGRLGSSDLSNSDLLEALRKIALTEQDGWLRAVDFKNLGAEELGSVYESLLELHPELDVAAGTFELKTAAGSERKMTGSYYTPTGLIECLLDSALDPVLDEAEKKRDPEKAILALKVCDPACGSGHFLIAAAHRIAKRLASIRTGEEEPDPGATRTALRDVIGHCLYGVDINPMAAELCRVALWIESVEPGKPLSFLDHHIQVGNSLLGATPELIAEGIPDEAFSPIEGDEKAACSAWKKQNKREREQKGLAELDVAPWDAVEKLGEARANLDRLADGRVSDVKAKEERWRQLLESSEYQRNRLLADAWCAAFVWKKTSEKSAPTPVTNETLHWLRRNPESVPVSTRAEVLRLSSQYQFFHWHLAFPEVFARPDNERRSSAPREDRESHPVSAGASKDVTAREAAGSGAAKPPQGISPGLPSPAALGGFDVVLGNPPWERVKLQEQEFFAKSAPEIAKAANAAARARMIAALSKENPALERAFLEARRLAEGSSQMIRVSGRYPLCGRGDVNTYSVFAELNRSLTGPAGRVGCIVPSGIATDDTTKFFFQEIVRSGSLASLFSFFETRRIFTASDSRDPFCLLTLRGPGSPLPLAGEGGAERRERASSFAFFLRSVDELEDPERRFTLTPEEIFLLNPNTGTCPIFRTRRDAEITKAIYRRVPVLINEALASRAADARARTQPEEQPDGNPWKISFMAMLHMANDSGLFVTRPPEFRPGPSEPTSPDLPSPSGRRWREAPDEGLLPLYEAKMIHHYDHRFGDYAMKPVDSENTSLPDVPLDRLQDAHYTPTPRYWVPAAELEARLKDRWDRGWLLGWRRNSRSTDERTFIASVIPRAAVGDSVFLMFPGSGTPDSLVACLASIPFDFAVRQKLGGTNNSFYIVQQLPVLPPATYESPAPWSPASTLANWIRPRVLELVYTAWDIQPFALDLGFSGPPFRWDPSRRFLLRCELDAAFFHLYGISRADADYILDTFPIVRRNDEKEHGEYRTKRVILEMYDEMKRAMETGKEFASRVVG